MQRSLFDGKAPKKYRRGNVKIGDYVWIGYGAFIGPCVTIGENAIVGANAVVTKDIPNFAIAGGVPAQILKYKD
jgi:maltose O-acetyltransferase